MGQTRSRIDSKNGKILKNTLIKIDIQFVVPSFGRLVKNNNILFYCQNTDIWQIISPKSVWELFSRPGSDTMVPTHVMTVLKYYVKFVAIY